MVGGLEPAFGSVFGIGLMMEAAVGEGTAKPLVKEEEQEGNLHAFGGEAVGVAGPITLQQIVPLELAQIVAQLVQAIALLREPESGQYGLVDLLGRPAADVRARVHEDLQQPDDAGLMDLDAGMAHRALGDRQGDALQKGKVDVGVQPLRLIRGEAAGDGLELFTDRLQVVQALLETEVLEIVGAELVAQERRELLVLPQDRVLEAGTEDVMAVLDLLDHRGKLAAHSAVQPLAEDLGDLVRRQPPEPQLAASLEQPCGSGSGA